MAAPSQKPRPPAAAKPEQEEGSAEAGSPTPQSSAPNGPHELQRRLAERLVVVADPDLPPESVAMRRIERFAAKVSRLAGPVLLVAALIGVFLLVF